jgi:hypothetical protein
MNNRLFFFIAIVFATLYLSCQDKYLMGNIPVAKGSLKSESSGACLPKTIAGTYIAGKSLTDTNYIEVAVNVKSTGTYIISTNSVNGYYFTAGGTFTSIGSNTIKLAAKGTPITAGINDLTVSFDTSVCHIAITISPAGGTPAVYTLSGAPNACANAVVSGAFARGSALDTFSKVNISVNVTTPGAYSITTNTVNGYKFSASGTFAVAGAQTVMLIPSGTPISSGTDAFTVNGSTGNCGFSITVLNPIAVGNNDHFPLTVTSYWNYDDLYNTGDTLKRYIPDSLVQINGFPYKVMYEQQKFGEPVPFLYRKTDSVYYEYTSVDKYTLSFKFGPAIVKDFPFLREYLKTGDTWTSDEYIGNATYGQQLFLRYDFTCDNANATVTLNGKTFTNVYKISMRPKIKSAATYPYDSTSELVQIWYAKGIGVIYSKKINNGFSIFENRIRYWQVK